MTKSLFAEKTINKRFCGNIENCRLNIYYKNIYYPKPIKLSITPINSNEGRLILVEKFPFSMDIREKVSVLIISNDCPICISTSALN